MYLKVVRKTGSTELIEHLYLGNENFFIEKYPNACHQALKDHPKGTLLIINSPALSKTVTVSYDQEAYLVSDDLKGSVVLNGPLKTSPHQVIDSASGGQKGFHSSKKK